MYLRNVYIGWELSLRDAYVGDELWDASCLLETHNEGRDVWKKHVNLALLSRATVLTLSEAGC